MSSQRKTPKSTPESKKVLPIAPIFSVGLQLQAFQNHGLKKYHYKDEKIDKLIQKHKI